MGKESQIIKLGTEAYRYLRYGKQIGKTAENGAAAYRRTGFMSGTTTLTGLDKNGNVIRTVRTCKTAEDTTRTTATTYMEHGAVKQTETVRSVGVNNNADESVYTTWFTKWLDKYGIELTPKGKPWCGQIHSDGNRVSGCVDIHGAGRRNFDKLM